MKTTMLMRPIANPRRTTLAHLKDAEPLLEAEPATDAEAVEIRPLPQQTANPRRTTLVNLPGQG
jgi:hypothetical protein